MNLAKFMNLLESAGLWFSRLDLLGDPREGRLTDGEYRSAVAHSGGQPDLDWPPDAYVSCWREGHEESRAMWDLYGGHESALAVKTTVGSLKQALAPSDYLIFFGRVQYLSWNEGAEMPNNVLALRVRKDAAYVHEREVRLVWEPLLEGHQVDPAPTELNITETVDVLADVAEDLGHNFALPRDELRLKVIRAIGRAGERKRIAQLEPGVLLKLPMSFIGEVVVGPDLPVWFPALVAKLCERYGVNVPVRKSGLQFSR